MAILLLACGAETLQQEDETGTVLVAPLPYWPGVVLIEREIVFREAIFRGTLSTVEAGAIGDDESKFRPSVKFNFAGSRPVKWCKSASS